MPPFARRANVPCSTKRSRYGSGAYENYATKLSGLACTPLYPAGRDWVMRFPLDPPHTLRTCYLDGSELDIQANDFLVAGGREYPILFVSGYPWRQTNRYELLLDVIAVANVGDDTLPAHAAAYLREDGFLILREDGFLITRE